MESPCSDTFSVEGMLCALGAAAKEHLHRGRPGGCRTGEWLEPSFFSTASCAKAVAVSVGNAIPIRGVNKRGGTYFRSSYGMRCSESLFWVFMAPHLGCCSCNTSESRRKCFTVYILTHEALKKTQVEPASLTDRFPRALKSLTCKPALRSLAVNMRMCLRLSVLVLLPEEAHEDVDDGITPCWLTYPFTFEMEGSLYGTEIVPRAAFDIRAWWMKGQRHLEASAKAKLDDIPKPITHC